LSAITTADKGSGQRLTPMTLELQFLEHHKKQFLDLHEGMCRITYAQQSEAAAGAQVDGDSSADSGADVGTGAPAPAVDADADSARSGCGALTNGGCTSDVDDAAEDAPLLDASAAPDVNDFTTWTPETWSRVDFSNLRISFPVDPISASVPSGHCHAL
jgi:hypothetical protein